MLLDMECMTSIAKNELFVTDGRQCLTDDYLTVLTNGGSQSFYTTCILRFLTLCVNVNRY